MGEAWDQLARESERVYHERVGMSYEYKQVELFRHPSGRFLERYEFLHVDADEARVRWSWLEDGSQRLAALEAAAAARAAQGETDYIDIFAQSKGAAPGAGASVAAQPASGDLAQALRSLLQRHGGFVIASEAGGRFLQFAGGVGEALLLDVPNLSAEEGIRASQAFAGQPFTVQGSTFNLRFGEDADAAARAALSFFAEVWRISAPTLSLEQE